MSLLSRIYLGVHVDGSETVADAVEFIVFHCRSPAHAGSPLNRQKSRGIGKERERERGGPVADMHIYI